MRSALARDAFKAMAIVSLALGGSLTFEFALVLIWAFCAPSPPVFASASSPWSSCSTNDPFLSVPISPKLPAGRKLELKLPWAEKPLSLYLTEKIPEFAPSTSCPPK